VTNKSASDEVAGAAILRSPSSSKSRQHPENPSVQAFGYTRHVIRPPLHPSQHARGRAAYRAGSPLFAPPKRDASRWVHLGNDSLRQITPA
jgi:hypothetical protein